MKDRHPYPATIIPASTALATSPAKVAKHGAPKAYLVFVTLAVIADALCRISSLRAGHADGHHGPFILMNASEKRSPVAEEENIFTVSACRSEIYVFRKRNSTASESQKPTALCCRHKRSASAYFNYRESRFHALLMKYRLHRHAHG